MPRQPLAIPLAERRALSVLETAAMYGISRATVYNLMNAGKLKSGRILGRRLILRESAEALFSEDGATPPGSSAAA